MSTYKRIDRSQGLILSYDFCIYHRRWHTATGGILDIYSALVNTSVPDTRRLMVIPCTVLGRLPPSDLQSLKILFVIFGRSSS